MLASDEFNRLYLAEGFVWPNKVPGLSREDYSNDKAMVERELREQLGKKWLSPDDFEVAWDENVALHSCGGVYSHQILCKEYVEIVNDVLLKTKRPDIWGYHTAVELEGVFTEFWIRNGIMHAPDDEFPWTKYFGDTT